MRKISLAALLCVLATTSIGLAQSPSSGITVSGRVQDARTKAPLPFLTVQLRTEKDTIFVAGRLTDGTGAFTMSGLKKGVYLLDAKIIGYEPLRQRVLIGELSAYLDLGVLPMVPVATSLGAVVVSANGSAVASAMDRKSYTLADNASQVGGSVVQAMSTLPGVTIGQDGKVQLRGSDKVAVLIDGKQTALTGAGTQSGLENLPASAIQSIEIISYPTAKYDANASAGIINLILNKEEQTGFNGKVGMLVAPGRCGSSARIFRRSGHSSASRPSSIPPSRSTIERARPTRSRRVIGCTRQRSIKTNSPRARTTMERSSSSRSRGTDAPTTPPSTAASITRSMHRTRSASLDSSIAKRSSTTATTHTSEAP